MHICPERSRKILAVLLIIMLIGSEARNLQLQSAFLHRPLGRSDTSKGVDEGGDLVKGLEQMFAIGSIVQTFCLFIDRAFRLRTRHDKDLEETILGKHPRNDRPSNAAGIGLEAPSDLGRLEAGLATAENDLGEANAAAKMVSTALYSDSQATALLAANIAEGLAEREHEHEIVRTMFKKDINLLLHVAWKLEPKILSQAKKLARIRRNVAQLIEDAYGHRLGVSSSQRNQSGSNKMMNVEDYVEFARDYFDVSDPTARKMFQKADLDQNGKIDFFELEQALEPLFLQHGTLQQLFDNGIKAASADKLRLFASTASVSSCDTDMVYLAKDIWIFVYGNFLLLGITLAMSLTSLFGFSDESALGLVLYILQSLIYILYCVVLWRYFRKDWWTTAGTWLYTLGYCVFAYYYYCEWRGVPDLLGESVLSADYAEIVGFSLFSMGSIPFFLALVDRSNETEHRWRFNYDHTNTAARGGVLFFLGSIYFLAATLRPKHWSTELSEVVDAKAYTAFAWGRIEFFLGILANARDSTQKLAAAALWRKMTTGNQVLAPNYVDRLVHLICGKQRVRLRQSGSESGDLKNEST